MQLSDKKSTKISVSDLSSGRDDFGGCAACVGRWEAQLLKKSGNSELGDKLLVQTV